MSNKIYFATKHDKIIIPSKRDEDGAYDLYADLYGLDYLKIEPFTSKMVPTGLYSAFDKKYRIVFQERGSTGIRNIKINAGLVDSGYRGEWIVLLYNANPVPLYIFNEMPLTPEPDAIYYPCDKAICQAKVEIVPKVKIEVVSAKELSEMKSNRGDGMLGSSGK